MNTIKTFLIDFYKDAKSFLSALLPENLFSPRILLIFTITIAGAIYRFSEIGLGVSYDEAYTYLAFIRGTYLQTATDYHLPNNHIFLSLILNFIFHNFGGELWVLRLPTLFFGTLMIPATYALGKRLYNPETGIFAAFAVAIFPELIHFSATFRGYIIVALFTLLIFILGDDLRREKNRFGWLVLVVIFTLGLYTIPTMLFPFAILYYWLFFSVLVNDFGAEETSEVLKTSEVSSASYTSNWDFLRYFFASGILTGLATLALYSPILLFSRDDLFNHHWLVPIPWEILLNRMMGKLMNTWIDWTAPFPTWLAWMGVFSALLTFIFHKKLAKHKFPLQIAFGLGITTMILIQRPNAWARVWTFSIAILLIWAAAGVVWLSAKLNIKNLSFDKILLGVMLVPLLWSSISLIPQLSLHIVEKSNGIASVDFLENELKSGDMILMDASHAPYFEYYLLVRGDNEIYFDRQKEFTRIILIVVNKDQENLDIMLQRFSEKYRFDLNTLKMLRRYGNYDIYEVFSLP